MKVIVFKVVELLLKITLLVVVIWYGRIFFKSLITDKENLNSVKVVEMTNKELNDSLNSVKMKSRENKEKGLINVVVESTEK